MSHPLHQLIEPLPSPGKIKQTLFLSPAGEHFIHRSRETVRAILDQKDPRLLVIVGPCSIHDPDSAIEFARRLIILQKETQDSFFLVMRVYSEKSRTKTGWKGLLNDPFLDSTEDIAAGLHITRQLLLDLNTMQIPTATEFLDPLSACYYDDLITWGCIGARTSESQTHRLMASDLPMPIAFKNSTQGCVDVAINGMFSASCPHRKISIDHNGGVCVKQTLGNPDLHIALRGGVKGANYKKENIKALLEQLQKHSLPEKILIDCSHDNSPNDECEQESVFMNILEQIENGNTAIRGMILESHLQGGKQKMDLGTPLAPEISITDPCLSWEKTASLIQTGAMLRGKTATCAL